MSETRKIAAILVADVVGYSRLAGADEDRTLSRLPTDHGSAEYVASHSRTNSLSSMLRETSAARTAASTFACASDSSAQRPADALSARMAVISAERAREPPIAASLACGMKTCRRRKPLDAGMIGRQGVFQIRDGSKRTALENLKAAGARQAHN